MSNTSHCTSIHQIATIFISFTGSAIGGILEFVKKPSFYGAKVNEPIELKTCFSCQNSQKN